jgi:hypothetical protein
MCTQCQHIDADHVDGRCKRCDCTQFAHPREIDRVDLSGQKYAAIAATPLRLTSSVKVPPTGGSW